MVGIYCCTNTKNGKQYIGQSINIENRLENHKYRFNNKNDSGYNTLLHTAMREDGYESFSVTILEECNIEDLFEKETMWMFKLNTFAPNGYNTIRSDKTIGRISSGTFYDKKGSRYNICPYCGEKKSASAKMCRTCHDAKHMNRIGIISQIIYVELIEKILYTSYEEVGREFGYKSGNSIRRIFKRNNYPVKIADIMKYYEDYYGFKHPSIVEKEQKEAKRKENAQKQAPRKVGMYTSDGTLIRTYRSTEEAERCGFNSGSVSRCCNGKQKTVRGFVFKYIE